MSEKDPQDHRLDHIVALMFENRSFDNLLGYLYTPSERPNFEGVLRTSFSNPVPRDVPGQELGPVQVHPAKGYSSPFPDPGEEFPHVNTQLYSVIDPPSNRFADVDDMRTPFNAPTDASSDTASMQGFVADFVNAYKWQMGRLPTRAQYEQIMACYRPEHVPVLSGLARGFTVFDHWFCEVPSQTYPNRSFFHAGTSSGFVVNGPPGKFGTHNTAPTIFERLDAAGKSWKVYFDPLQFVPATGLIHASRLAQYFSTHFTGMTDFYSDAKEGVLPNYAFIEPNMFHPHTDMHPHSGARLAEDLGIPPPDTLAGGEHLLAQVYAAIRTSSASNGSNWSNTALLVTFDEHGGCFDHVSPPSAAPPDGAPTPGEQGFRFNRSGVRIPTILVSAWTDPSSIVSTEFRSTSLIATLRDWWQLGEPLTHRDSSAASFLPVLRRSTPVLPENWPDVTPRRVGPVGKVVDWIETLAEDAEVRFDRLEHELLGETLQWEFAQGMGPAPPDVSGISHGEAHEHFRRAGGSLFPQVVLPKR
ncbi:MAG TPA: alkaline phosphatase family protein [Thermoplasmata archaeon]|nr:alkaline phosphatase family protein [Thermoplasmata archaeon]